MDRFALFEGNLHTASSGRTTFWLNALGVMAESPLSFVTGFGFDAYESSREFSAAVHNHYLNKLFNLGLIGLALFLAVFGSMLSIFRASIMPALQDSKPFLFAVVIGLLCLLVTQIFGQYYRSGYLIWACLGVCLRLAMEIRRETAEITGNKKNGQLESQSDLWSTSVR
jgi:O-antigen ligase